MFERLTVESRFTENDAKRIFTQVLQALQFLHNEKKTAHRDLKVILPFLVLPFPSLFLPPLSFLLPLPPCLPFLLSHSSANLPSPSYPSLCPIPPLLSFPLPHSSLTILPLLSPFSFLPPFPFSLFSLLFSIPPHLLSPFLFPPYFLHYSFSFPSLPSPFSFLLYSSFSLPLSFLSFFSFLSSCHQTASSLLSKHFPFQFLLPRRFFLSPSLDSCAISFAGSN